MGATKSKAFSDSDLSRWAELKIPGGSRSELMKTVKIIKVQVKKERKMFAVNPAFINVRLRSFNGFKLKFFK